MGLRIKRNLGRVRHLDSGQYTLETVSGRPAIACPRCGGITDIDEPYTIDVGGVVTPVWQCDGCSFREWIVLEDLEEDVVR